MLQVIIARKVSVVVLTVDPSANAFLRAVPFSYGDLLIQGQTKGEGLPGNAVRDIHPAYPDIRTRPQILGMSGLIYVVREL